MACLSLIDLCMSYDGRTRAVDGISLEVADGEVVTVLGPSGCGKSTLLRLIAGLERPESGEIRIDGAGVAGREPKDRDVAMVFQSYALYPHMRVYDNVAAPLRLRGLPAAEVRRRVEETAGKLGIREHLRRYPRQLSGGEQQRVALARALVRRPKLFLLDEPLSNLDAQLREQARSEMKQIFREAGTTVLYVTHDQVEALTLSDRIAVMNQGRLEQVGRPAEIYERPISLFVAGFVGSPRMNLIAGPLLGEEAATVGYRPEDVEVTEEGTLEMHLEGREPLGRQHLLSLCRGELRLRAVVPAQQRVGNLLRIRLRPERAHLFDTAGRRLDRTRA